MLDRFLNIPKKFITLHVTLDEFKYYLNAPRVYTETMLPLECFTVVFH